MLEPVFVTATRGPLPLARTLADVTVLHRDDIERKGAGTVADVLRGVPGMELVRNGGPGTVTSVLTRGAEGRFTAVLVDGVRVDSQVTGGATWQAIPLSQIERIEIVRGPASAVYGSDAIAGVVQIFTRRGAGPASLDLGIGAGSLGTAKADAAVHGAQGAVDYALSIAAERSRGFNAIVNPDNPSYNPDRDGYRSRSANGRLGVRLDPAHRLEFTAFASRLDSQYDGFMSAADDRNLHALRAARALWSAQWSRAWQSRVSIGESADRYETRPQPYLTETRIRSYAWQNEVRLGAHRVDATLERREDRLENSLLSASPVPGQGQRHQDALALGYGWRDGGGAVQAHWRHDRDSEFGRRDTGALTAGLDLLAGWRLSASAGTAFRAPTLFQRFSPFGNAGLVPESARTVEATVGWRQPGAELGLTAYRSRIEDLITFGEPGACASASGCYRNTAQARLQGLTLKGLAEVGWLRLSGSLDLQSPTDLTTGNLLPRRARRHAALRADGDLGGWTLGAQWLLSGPRFDDAANTRPLGGYGVVNLDAQYRIDARWRLLLRIDNALDRNYQTARDYATQPRMGFVGLRWTPPL